MTTRHLLILEQYCYAFRQLFGIDRSNKIPQVAELIAKAAEQVRANEPDVLRYHIQRDTKGDSIIVLET